jgi:hypothetical protein
VPGWSSVVEAAVRAPLIRRSLRVSPKFIHDVAVCQTEAQRAGPLFVLQAWHTPQLQGIIGNPTLADG